MVNRPVAMIFNVNLLKMIVKMRLRNREYKDPAGMASKQFL